MIIIWYFNFKGWKVFCYVGIVLYDEFYKIVVVNYLRDKYLCDLVFGIGVVSILLFIYECI